MDNVLRMLWAIFLFLVLFAILVVVLLLEYAPSPENLETTKRIQDCEKLIEELNGQINQHNQLEKLRISLIKKQKSKMDTLNALASIAVKRDTALARQVRGWGWTITKQEKK